MQRLVRLISVADIWLLQTRTPVKEIAYWIGMLGIGSVFLANVYMMQTIQFMGDKLWKWDLVKDNEWVYAAVILAVCQLIYIADTILLIRKKAAQYADLLTYLNEMTFWVIVSYYGFRFSNQASCSDGLNIFACAYNGKVREGRWPLLWILPVCKLTIDIGLFIIFRFVQKRLISHGHGQSVAGLLLDIQYLLVSLWFGGYAFNLEARSILAKREFYEARHVFIVVFSIAMTLPFIAIACVVLAVYDFQRSFWFRALSRLMAGVWCCVGFATALVLDASLGDFEAGLIDVIKGLTIVLVALATSYAVINVYFKIKTKDDSYISFDKSRALPITERMPIFIHSAHLRNTILPQSGAERENLGEA
jgi:hypothetical protein